MRSLMLQNKSSPWFYDSDSDADTEMRSMRCRSSDAEDGDDEQ
jgi:hypothetical protein